MGLVKERSCKDSITYTLSAALGMPLVFQFWHQPFPMHYEGAEMLMTC